MAGFRTFFNKFILQEFKKSGAFKKLQENAASATPGSRAWPKKSSVGDKKIGVRLDWGDKFTQQGVEYRNLVLQANADAENEAIRAIANKGTDQKLLVLKLRLDGKDGADEWVEGWKNNM